MSEPKTEVFSRPSGDIEVRTTFDAFFVSELQRGLPRVIEDKAATAIAAELLKTKGAEIIASIDLKHVVNLAVAKVVTQIADGSTKK